MLLSKQGIERRVHVMEEIVEKKRKEYPEAKININVVHQYELF